MGAKAVTTFLQCSAQPIVHHSPSTSQTLTSATSSASWKRLRCRRREGGSLSCCFFPQRLKGSAIFGIQSTKLHRSKSCELWELSKTTKTKTHHIRSASLDSFSDEEFSKKIQELALKFQVSHGEEDDENIVNDSEPEIIHDSIENHDDQEANIVDSYDYGLISSLDEAKPALDSVEPPWHSIERKANSVDLPLSLRIIKRKLQWEEGLKEASDLAYCSMKKAFSSMVFMIRELHSFTLQMRELLFYEDVQGILRRVQKEMHASFVWIFKQVFSQTPTLMVYVMILLANFTVYSLGANTALAASPPPTTADIELSTVVKTQEYKNEKFDSSLIKRFSGSSSNVKATSIGGSNGGGGKVRPLASGTEGEGWFDGSDHFRTIIPDGALDLSSSLSSRMIETDPSVSGQESRGDEISLWNSVMEEAERMQASTRDETLNHETMRRFVSPVEVNIAEDDYMDYFKTELLYQTGLAQEPNNPLLLANYAQFLFVVAHDYDRAEECFKRAIGVQPPDAEAYNKYATFLWRARNDLWAAEETFLEAISADPTNSYYSANYAHFLWNTGGEDTCFPLSSPETSQEA